MSAVDWPSSPLDAAQRAFNLLVEPPTHVGFDGRGFDGLPNEILPLDRLRDLLLSAAPSVEVCTGTPSGGGIRPRGCWGCWCSRPWS